eukprot:m.420031 g.420031  ORF g.420031 m.420031 type:complete len:430 (+) comp32041_c0_seq1:215-1504(+)
MGGERRSAGRYGCSRDAHNVSSSPPAAEPHRNLVSTNRVMCRSKTTAKSSHAAHARGSPRAVCIKQMSRSTCLFLSIVLAAVSLGLVEGLDLLEVPTTIVPATPALSSQQLDSLETPTLSAQATTLSPRDAAAALELWRAPESKAHRAILPPEARYDYTHKVLMCVSPKAGSSSFYRWLYHISTGGKDYDKCSIFTAGRARYHPHHLGPCWNAGTGRTHRLNITNPNKLPKEEQLAILNDPDVFRFAITRKPVARAISAWKSKLACDGLYNTDLGDRPQFLVMLLDIAVGWSKKRLADPTCMSLMEYAKVLRAIPPHSFRALAHVAGGPHFAPQTSTCMLGKLAYNETQALETMTPLSPSIRNLVERFRTDLVHHPLLHNHGSTLQTNATARPSKISAIRGATIEEVEEASRILAKVFGDDSFLAQPPS